MPIEKRKLDEKTYELRNTEPYLGPTPITQAAMDAQNSIRSGERSAQMFEEMMKSEQKIQEIERHQVKGGGATSVDDFLQAAKEAPPEQKHAWRKQFSDLDKNLKKGFDPDFAIPGIQDMLDSGALYMDDDGNVYSSVPGRGGPKRNDRLLYAAKEWGDWYRDQLAYGEDVAPNGRASVEMDRVVNQERLKNYPSDLGFVYDPASGGFIRP